MSTDATGQTYHVVQLRGLGNVPLYPAIQKAEVINLLTSASSLPPTTKAVVDYVLQAVQGGSGGGETTLSPAVITFTSSDLTDGVLSISYDRFVADSNTPVEVALVDSNGVVRTADSAVTLYWNDTGLHIDLSDCEVTGTWKVCYGIVTGTSADYLMTQEVTSTSTNTEVPTAKAVYEALSPIITAVGVAQSTADTALADAADAQTAANSKLSAPAAAGTAGQVLALAQDGTTPEWTTPAAGGGGGLTKWGAWQNISAATEYTAETNGWLRVSSLSPGDVSVIIDGVTVFQASHQDDSGTTFMKIGMIIPVFTGQVYYIEGAIDPQFAPCV